MAVEDFLAGEGLAGLEGFKTFGGAFLAGADFLGAGLGGAFLDAGFLAGAGFLGTEDFLAGFDWEAERGELLEEVDLVFKLLSLRSFTLGQKGVEDRPFGLLGQGFVFEFFDSPRASNSNRLHGF